jgi:hypothetical protein
MKKVDKSETTTHTQIVDELIITNKESIIAQTAYGSAGDREKALECNKKNMDTRGVSNAHLHLVFNQ